MSSSYQKEQDIIINFMDDLNQSGYVAYITGGHAFKKHFNQNENTSDWDIHIYLTPNQMKDSNNYLVIYDIIKQLYHTYSNLHSNLYKLKKFDYAYWAKKYITSKYRNKETSYYNSNVICDIQFENRKDTFLDISLSCSFDIDLIKNKIDNHYICSESLIKDITKYYEDLKNANQDKNKILKVKNRLRLIKEIINLSD